MCFMNHLFLFDRHTKDHESLKAHSLSCWFILELFCWYVHVSSFRIVGFKITFYILFKGFHGYNTCVATTR